MLRHALLFFFFIEVIDILYGVDWDELKAVQEYRLTLGETTACNDKFLTEEELDIAKWAAYEIYIRMLSSIHFEYTDVVKVWISEMEECVSLSKTDDQKNTFEIALCVGQEVLDILRSFET